MIGVTVPAPSSDRRASKETSAAGLGWSLVAIAVLARVLVFAAVSHDERKFYAPDSVTYERLAANLRQRGAFTADPGPPFTPDAIRGPVYPAVIAVVVSLVGDRPAWVIALQITLAGLTAGLTLWLALAVGLSSWAAAIAALVVAIDPVSVMTANLLLTETLFTTLTVVGVGSIVRYWRTPRLGWLIGSAAALGLAGLTRPIGQFLPLLLVPFFYWFGRPSRWRALLRVGLPFLAIAALVMGGWAYRNHREVGVFTVSIRSSKVLYGYWVREVVADAEGIGQETSKRRLAGEMDRQAAGLARPARAEIERREAIAILIGHPRETLRMLASGAGRLLFDPGFTLACTLLDPADHSTECIPGLATMNEAGAIGRARERFVIMTVTQQMVLAASALLLAVTYAGAVLGLVTLAREGPWSTLALLVVVIGSMSVLSAGAQAEPRFRVPLMPFVAISAGLGLERLTNWWRTTGLRGRSSP